MLLAEIGVYLAAQSVSVPFNTTLVRAGNLFEGELPADPVVAIALVEYGGMPPELAMGAETVRLEQPRFQLKLRHTTFATGRLLIEQAKAALIAIGNESLSGVRYLTVTALQSNPNQMPRDENRRWIWTMNFEAIKEPSAS
jgi:hypothetical protein